MDLTEEDWLAKYATKQSNKLNKNDDSTLYQYSNTTKNIIKSFSDVSNIATKTLIELNNFKITYDHEFEELTAVFDTKLSNDSIENNKIPEYIINEMNSYKQEIKAKREKLAENDVIERLHKPKTRSKSPVSLHKSPTPKNVNKSSKSPSLKPNKSLSLQQDKEELSAKIEKVVSNTNRSTIFRSVLKSSAEASAEQPSHEVSNIAKPSAVIPSIVRKPSLSGLEAAPSGYLKSKTTKASSYFKPLPSGSISMNNKHLNMNKEEHHLEPLKETDDNAAKKVSLSTTSKSNVFDRLTSMSTVASTMRYGGARVTGKRVSPVKLKKSPIKINTKKITITPKRSIDAKIKGAAKRDQKIESPTNGMTDVVDFSAGGTFSTPANVKVVDRAIPVAKSLVDKKPVVSSSRVIKNKINIPLKGHNEVNEKENKEINKDIKKSPFKSPTKLNSVLYDLDLKDHRQRLGDIGKSNNDYVNETLPEIVSDSDTEDSKQDAKNRLMKDWAADSSLLSLIRSQQRDKTKDPTRIFGPIQNVGQLDKILE
ncbi:Inner centromere protein-related protein HuSLI15 [Hanseniaspora uvarum DSM 2768]|nr:Inner centromere protein-related protein HuSLI15 [Hanseniaspora uvarum DSM 2768]